MKVSTRARYAVRALFIILKEGGYKPVKLEKIAKEQKISLSYLEQLFNKLKNHRIVVSVKGPHGGYRLAEKPENITLAKIFEATGEKIMVADCFERKCRLSKNCVSRPVWKKLQSVIADYLNSVSLKTIAEMNNLKIKEEKSSVPHNYSYFI